MSDLPPFWQRPGGAGSTTINFSDAGGIMRSLIATQPALAKDPQALQAMASSLATNDAGMVPLVQARVGTQIDQRLAALQGMDSDAEKEYWQNLTVGAQQSFLKMGYKPLGDGNHGGFLGVDWSSPTSVLAAGATAGLKTFYTPVKYGIGAGLKVLSEASEIPGEFYREAIRNENRGQIFAMLGGAALIAGAVALTVVTGGAGAPTIAGAVAAATGAVGTAGAIGAGAVVGGIAGYEASNLVMDATGDASSYLPVSFRGEDSGEFVFRNSDRAHVGTLLATDPTGALVGTLGSLALAVDGSNDDDTIDPTTAATELAVSVAGLGDYTKAIDRWLARQGYSVGTPEYSSAAFTLQAMMDDPAMKESVAYLAERHISPGRDMVRSVGGTVGLDPNHGWGRVVSGAGDFAFQLWADPVALSMGVSKASMAMRYGFTVLEDVEKGAVLSEKASRAMDAAMTHERMLPWQANWQRMRTGILDVLNTEGAGQTEAIRRLGRQNAWLPHSLERWGDQAGRLAGQTWTADEVDQAMKDSSVLTDLLKGNGIATGIGHTQLPTLSAARAWTNQSRFAVRAYVDGIADFRVPIQDADRMAVHAETRVGQDMGRRFWSSNLAVRQGETADDVLNRYESYRIAQRLITNPLTGLLVRQNYVSRLLRAPIGVASDLMRLAPTKTFLTLDPDSPGHLEDVKALVDMAAHAGVPRYVRDAWFDVLSDSISPATQRKAIESFVGTMLKASGLENTDHGRDFINVFLRKSHQALEGSVGSDSVDAIARSGVFPSQMAASVSVPDLHQVAYNLRKDMISRAVMGINGNPWLANVDRIWRSAVLLRIGFVTRNAAEELAGFLFRAGSGQLVTGAAARKIAAAENRQLTGLARFGQFAYEHTFRLGIQNVTLKDGDVLRGRLVGSTVRRLRPNPNDVLPLALLRRYQGGGRRLITEGILGKDSRIAAAIGRNPMLRNTWLKPDSVRSMLLHGVEPEMMAAARNWARDPNVKAALMGRIASTHGRWRALGSLDDPDNDRRILTTEGDLAHTNLVAFSNNYKVIDPAADGATAAVGYQLERSLAEDVTTGMQADSLSHLNDVGYLSAFGADRVEAVLGDFVNHLATLDPGRRALVGQLLYVPGNGEEQFDRLLAAHPQMADLIHALLKPDGTLANNAHRRLERGLDGLRRLGTPEGDALVAVLEPLMPAMTGSANLRARLARLATWDDARDPIRLRFVTDAQRDAELKARVSDTLADSNSPIGRALLRSNERTLTLSDGRRVARPLGIDEMPAWVPYLDRTMLAQLAKRDPAELLRAYPGPVGVNLVNVVQATRTRGLGLVRGGSEYRLVPLAATTDLRLANATVEAAYEAAGLPHMLTDSAMRLATVYVPTSAVTRHAGGYWSAEIPPLEHSTMTLWRKGDPVTQVLTPHGAAVALDGVGQEATMDELINSYVGQIKARLYNKNTLRDSPPPPRHVVDADPGPSGPPSGGGGSGPAPEPSAPPERLRPERIEEPVAGQPTRTPNVAPTAEQTAADAPPVGSDAAAIPAEVETPVANYDPGPSPASDGGPPTTSPTGGGPPAPMPPASPEAPTVAPGAAAATAGAPVPAAPAVPAAVPVTTAAAPAAAAVVTPSYLPVHLQPSAAETLARDLPNGTVVLRQGDNGLAKELSVVYEETASVLRTTGGDVDYGDALTTSLPLGAKADYDNNVFPHRSAGNEQLYGTELIAWADRNGVELRAGYYQDWLRHADPERYAREYSGEKTPALIVKHPEGFPGPEPATPFVATGAAPHTPGPAQGDQPLADWVAGRPVVDDVADLPPAPPSGETLTRHNVGSVLPGDFINEVDAEGGIRTRYVVESRDDDLGVLVVYNPDHPRQAVTLYQSDIDIDRALRAERLPELQPDQLRTGMVVRLRGEPDAQPYMVKGISERELSAKVGRTGGTTEVLVLEPIVAGGGYQRARVIPTAELDTYSFFYSRSMSRRYLNDLMGRGRITPVELGERMAELELELGPEAVAALNARTTYRGWAFDHRPERLPIPPAGAPGGAVPFSAAETRKALEATRARMAEADRAAAALGQRLTAPDPSPEVKARVVENRRQRVEAQTARNASRRGAGANPSGGRTRLAHRGRTDEAAVADAEALGVGLGPATIKAPKPTYADRQAEQEAEGIRQAEAELSAEMAGNVERRRLAQSQRATEVADEIRAEAALTDPETVDGAEAIDAERVQAARTRRRERNSRLGFRYGTDVRTPDVMRVSNLFPAMAVATPDSPVKVHLVFVESGWLPTKSGGRDGTNPISRFVEALERNPVEVQAVHVFGADMSVTDPGTVQTQHSVWQAWKDLSDRSPERTVGYQTWKITDPATKVLGGVKADEHVVVIGMMQDDVLGRRLGIPSMLPRGTRDQRITELDVGATLDDWFAATLRGELKPVVGTPGGVITQAIGHMDPDAAGIEAVVVDRKRRYQRRSRAKGMTGTPADAYARQMPVVLEYFTRSGGLRSDQVEPWLWTRPHATATRDQVLMTQTPFLTQSSRQDLVDTMLLDAHDRRLADRLAHPPDEPRPIGAFAPQPLGPAPTHVETTERWNTEVVPGPSGRAARQVAAEQQAQADEAAAAEFERLMHQQIAVDRANAVDDAPELDELGNPIRTDRLTGADAHLRDVVTMSAPHAMVDIEGRHWQVMEKLVNEADGTLRLELKPLDGLPSFQMPEPGATPTSGHRHVTVTLTPEQAADPRHADSVPVADVAIVYPGHGHYRPSQISPPGQPAYVTDPDGAYAQIYGEVQNYDTRNVQVRTANLSRGVVWDEATRTVIIDPKFLQADLNQLHLLRGNVTSRRARTPIEAASQRSRTVDRGLTLSVSPALQDGFDATKALSHGTPEYREAMVALAETHGSVFAVRNPDGTARYVGGPALRTGEPGEVGIDVLDDDGIISQTHPDWQAGPGDARRPGDGDSPGGTVAVLPFPLRGNEAEYERLKAVAPLYSITVVDDGGRYADDLIDALLSEGVHFQVAATERRAEAIGLRHGTSLSDDVFEQVAEVRQNAHIPNTLGAQAELAEGQWSIKYSRRQLRKTRKDGVDRVGRGPDVWTAEEIAHSQAHYGVPPEVWWSYWKDQPVDRYEEFALNHERGHIVSGHEHHPQVAGSDAGVSEAELVLAQEREANDWAFHQMDLPFGTTAAKAPQMLPDPVSAALGIAMGPQGIVDGPAVARWVRDGGVERYQEVVARFLDHLAGGMSERDAMLLTLRTMGMPVAGAQTTARLGMAAPPLAPLAVTDVATTATTAPTLDDGFLWEVWHGQHGGPSAITWDPASPSSLEPARHPDQVIRAVEVPGTPQSPLQTVIAKGFAGLGWLMDESMRQPMAFAAYAQSFRETSRMQHWLRDPELWRAARDPGEVQAFVRRAEPTVAYTDDQLAVSRMLLDPRRTGGAPPVERMAARLSGGQPWFDDVGVPAPLLAKPGWRERTLERLADNPTTAARTLEGLLTNLEIVTKTDAVAGTPVAAGRLIALAQRTQAKALRFSDFAAADQEAATRAMAHLQALTNESPVAAYQVLATSANHVEVVRQGRRGLIGARTTARRAGDAARITEVEGRLNDLATLQKMLATPYRFPTETRAAEAMVGWFQSALERAPGTVRKALAGDDAALARLNQLHNFGRPLAADQLATLSAAARGEARLAERASRIAVERGINEVIPFIDRDSVRSQFADLHRRMFPFWNAEEQFVKRWARMAWQNPARIRRAQLLVHGMETTGMIQTDENGTKFFVYPGSPLMTEMIGRIPGLRSVAPLAVGYSGQLRMSMPGLTQFGVPSISPWIAMPMRSVETIFPELGAKINPLTDALQGDVASNLGMVRALVPTQIMRFYDAFAGDESDVKYASAMTKAAGILIANGEMPDEGDAADKQRFLDRVKGMARTILVTQALIGMAAPSSPSAYFMGGDHPGSPGRPSDMRALLGIDAPDAFLNDEYVALARQLGPEQATVVFLSRYPDATPFDLVSPAGGTLNHNLAYTVSGSTTLSGAPLSPTEAVMSIVDANLPTITKSPYGALWLVPNSPPGAADDSSIGLYTDQIQAKLRQRRMPADMVDAYTFAVHADPYFKTMETYTKALDATIDPTQRNYLQTQRSLFSSTYQQTHPLFADQLTNGEGMARRRQVLDELATLAQDPSASQLTRTEYGQSILSFMTVLEQYRLRSAQLGYQPQAAQREAKAALHDKIEDWAQRMIVADPRLGVFWRSIIQPEMSDA